ncbi:non-ribosomal peptide synthetase [Phytopseudomonas daroniae]|uniref:non-ribosomal peptide synthetase n=1 Tax=Phytopseudomonas daroniae TaxID=2487519 RepID=UPI00103849C4|nr:non-ribosomal peptide synthetase [Pseudomonas daroniae]TBU72204.1 non-ribosomal peptide synthetase [Pseudomonas daroniae]
MNKQPPVRNKADIEIISGLSSLQQGILFHSLQAEGQDPYFYQFGFDIEGPFDQALFCQAWEQVAGHYQVMRSNYRWEEVDKPLQIVFKTPWLDIDVTHVDHLSSDATEQVIKERLSNSKARGFDFRQGTPVSIDVFVSGENRWCFYWSLHHISLDGWSVSKVLGDLLMSYQALLRGEVYRLSASLPYTRYIQWGHEQDKTALDAYWQRVLCGFDEKTPLPLRATRQDTRYAEQTVVFSYEDSQRIRSFARQAGVTVNTLVQAAWGLLLAGYADRDEALFGVTTSGRSASLAGIQTVVGVCINTLPSRIPIDNQQNVVHWLQRLQQQSAESREFEFTPLSGLPRYTDLSEGEALFDSILVFENYPIDEALKQAPGALRVRQLDDKSNVLEDGKVLYRGGRNNYPLSVIASLGDQLELTLAYHCKDYSNASVAELALQLEHRMMNLVASGDLPVGRLTARAAAVRLEGERQSFAAHDFLALWRHSVERQGNRDAVVASGDRVSYETLEQRSNQLARYLQAQGIQAGHIVALCQERSVDWVTSLLAVLKVGAVYLPIDNRQPVERLQQIVRDSAARLVIQSGRFPFAALEGCPVLVYEPERWSTCSSEPPAVEIDPSQAAYTIYTSGSTGQPKGVVISHRALANYLQAVRVRLDLPENANMAMVSTIAADLGHTMLFGALASGNTLHLLSQEHAFDPDHFARYMAEARISVLKIVPSHLQGLLQAARPADVLPEQVLILGGEAMSWQLVEHIRELKPQCRIINHYGPTETTVGTLTYEVDQAAQSTHSVPVGRPLSNTCALILDARLNPVAPNASGELYLGGRGLAQGYLGRAAQTAERFIPTDGGERLYRSGDRAGLTDEGQVQYIGRTDDQVKIRGYRVEPGEVGRVLQSLPGVRESAVLALPMENDVARLQLVGYCAVEPDVTSAHIQQALKARMPDYMVPAQVILVDRLPLTANGKLDKQALPESGAPREHYRAPTNEVESLLASVWAEVLKLERVGTNDNFFELGGDSILSLQIIARAKRKGLKLTPKQVFEKQTIGQLALVARRIETRPTPDPHAKGTVTGKLALLPAQSRFFEQAIEQRHHWNQSILLQPRQALRSESLQAALLALLEQHDALRVRFSQSAEGQWQAAFKANDVPDILWNHKPCSLDELNTLADVAQRSLHLERGSLFRAVLFDLPGNEQRLLLIAHHLIVDGVSWRILLEDLQTAYQQLEAGKPVRIAPKTSSLQQWSEKLHLYARDDALQAEVPYWLASPDDTPRDLPRDNDEGTLVSAQAACVQSCLSAELTDKLLKQAPAAYRTQINDLLLTALAKVLCSWAQAESVLIQLEGHGREDLFDDIDISRTVGWFTSLYPVKLTPQAGIEASIKTIKEQLRSLPAKGIGYGIARYLGNETLREKLAALPEPRVTFNYLGQFDGSFSSDEGALFTPAAERCGRGQDDSAPLGNWLTINGQVFNGELRLEWTFSQDMYRPQTIENLAFAYEQVLRDIVDHCADERHGGVTSSDFPLAGLTQQQLDRFPVPATDIEDIYPLSPMQEGMLFHTLIDKDAGDYINQLRVDIKGLDVTRFRQAWQKTIARHEVLRANFLTEFDRPVQVIRKQIDLPFTVLDWRQQDGLETALDQCAAADRQRGFDLLGEPLSRLTLIQTGPQNHHLIYTRHHILLDGWSSSRLLDEVLQHYRGEQPEALQGRFRDHIEWLEAQDKHKSEAFWREQVKALEVPTRLVQAIRQDSSTLGEGHGDYYQMSGRPQTSALTEFSRKNRVTINSVVQAAWLLLLQRYTGQDCVAFGATVSGRPADLKGVEQQLGLFINTLPIVASPRAEQRVDEWIAQVQSLNLALREYEHAPLYDIQRWAGSGGEGLFDTLMVFENYPVSQALQKGGTTDLEFTQPHNLEQTNYPLTLLIDCDDTLSIRYTYDRRLFSDQTVVQIARHFDHLLHCIVEHPSQCIARLSVLAMDEQQQVISQWNTQHTRYQDAACIHQLIEAQSGRRPEAVAVVDGERRLTYRQLNQRANRMAHALREQGVDPDVLVGLAVQRSADMVVGVLAILKAGGAYVPLDPEYPQDRLAFMIQDSGIRLLLTDTHLQTPLSVPAGVRCLSLQALADESAHCSEADPHNLTRPDNLAYVIYTSGSTGHPKGVLVPHGNVVRLLQATQDEFQFDEHDVWSVFHSYAFDFSVWELFGALLHGARAVMVPKDVARAPEAFHALLVNEQVTVLNQTPSAFKQLIPVACKAAEEGAGLALRYVIFGGEALDIGSLRAWWACHGDKRPQLFNMYGITETTVHVTYCPLSCNDLDSGAVSPIGKVIKDLSWFLLDNQLSAAAPGCQGELHVGQAGLARGYHQHPALTAERFIPDPFDSSAQGGGRLYRSGDLACSSATGVIEYLGRIDHQVKIRGFRIELGEIESALREHADIQEAVVLDVDGPGGSRQLAAYLIAADARLTGVEDQATSRTALREHLQAVLPDYMVPAHLLFLDELPLTPNGKLDRKALPAPEGGLQRDYLAPQSDLEQQIAAVWADVLRVGNVGLGDHFFELGGHSLLATQVASRLSEEAGITVSLRDVFEFPRLMDLAKMLTGKLSQVDPAHAELAKSIEALKRLTAEEIDELIS